MNRPSRWRPEQPHFGRAHIRSPMNLEGSHVRLNFGDIYYLDGTVAEVDFELEQFYFQPDLRGAFTGWISFQEFGLAPNKEGLWRISSFAEEVPEDEDDEE